MKARNYVILTAIVVALLANVAQAITLTTEQGVSVDLKVSEARPGAAKATKMDATRDSFKVTLQATPGAACDLFVFQGTGAATDRKVGESSITTTLDMDIKPSESWYPPAGQTTTFVVQCSTGGTPTERRVTVTRK